MHLNLMRIVDFQFRLIQSLINEEETFKGKNASGVHGNPYGFSFFLSLYDSAPFLTSDPINKYSFIYIALIVYNRRNAEHPSKRGPSQQFQLSLVMFGHTGFAPAFESSAVTLNLL